MSADTAIQVRIDPTNPGQFFACCGLLELANRLWRGAEGWFARDIFCLRSNSAADVVPTLQGLLQAITGADLTPTNPEDEAASPIRIGPPFGLRLDWWTDRLSGGSKLKVWAGSMRNARIAAAMQNAMRSGKVQTDALFDSAMVVYAPDEPDKKVEPFYFDARRGASALPVDVGFSPDSLGLTAMAFPAVELLCLVGLQRFRPGQTREARRFEYRTWTVPLPPILAALAVCGQLPALATARYQFENAFRTDQKKHKAFLPATKMEVSDD